MNVKTLSKTYAALVLVLGTASVAPARPPTNDRPGHSTRAGVRTARPRYPVSLDQALYLVRSTLLTLNNADRSGNYTVLRDLASPRFQAENTDADLAGHFKDLRRRRIDLYAVALEAPHLTTPPALDNDGMLQLKGYFPTRPLRITFNLKFQDVSGHWRLFAISVGTPKAPPSKSSAASSRTASPHGPGR